MDRCPANNWTSRRLQPLRWRLRAAAVMKVRRPACDEHPSKPSSLNNAANQLTTLVGRKHPPRAERMTGPEGWLTLSKLRRARYRSGCVGMRRPPRFLAIESCTARLSATLPRASSTIDHSSRAISQARSPALTDKRIITRSRAGNGALDVLSNMRRNIWCVTTLACLPGISRNSFGCEGGIRVRENELETVARRATRNDLGDGRGTGTARMKRRGLMVEPRFASCGFNILPRASL